MITTAHGHSHHDLALGALRAFQKSVRPFKTPKSKLLGNLNVKNDQQLFGGSDNYKIVI